DSGFLSGWRALSVRRHIERTSALSRCVSTDRLSLNQPQRQSTPCHETPSSGPTGVTSGDSSRLVGVPGELVLTTTGTWITHPQTRCPNGHSLGGKFAFVVTSVDRSKIGGDPSNNVDQIGQ